MSKMLVASVVTLGGLTLYEVGHQDEDMLIKIVGGGFALFGIYEITKNTALSIISNFKRNLESKIK